MLNVFTLKYMNIVYMYNVLYDVKIVSMSSKNVYRVRIGNGRVTYIYTEIMCLSRLHIGVIASGCSMFIYIYCCLFYMLYNIHN